MAFGILRPEAQHRAEAIHHLNAEIEALHKVEVEQCNQIQEAEARLSVAQAESDRLADEAARLNAEEEARRQVDAEAQQQQFAEAREQLESEGRRLEQEHQQRAAALAAVRAQAAGGVTGNLLETEGR